MGKGHLRAIEKGHLRVINKVFFFYKKSSIKLPKKQKNKYKYACGLMTETDTHTHASNDSYEHTPRP